MQILRTMVALKASRRPSAVTIPRAHHSISNDAISKNALNVVRKLIASGFKAYLVGGCIRDLLSGIIPKDYDIVTDARPEAIKKLFRRSHIIGKRFKLVHVYMQHELFEVNTFRAEPSSWMRWMHCFFRRKHTLNNVYGDISQDVWRRDFTVNALYYDVETQEIIDYCQGYEDCKRRQVHCIGRSEERVLSDPIRMLRALRFKAKTGFQCDKALEIAIAQHKGLLAHQSKDRMLLEVEKFFLGGDAEKSFQVLNRFKVWNVVFNGYQEVLHRDDMVFLKAFFAHMDLVSRGIGRKSGYLFAGVFWPLVAKKVRFSPETSAKAYQAFLQECKQVLWDAGTVVKLTKALQFDIMGYWKLQYHLMYMGIEECERVSKKPLFIQAVRLFLLRARFDDTMADRALYWSRVVL